MLEEWRWFELSCSKFVCTPFFYFISIYLITDLYLRMCVCAAAVWSGNSKWFKISYNYLCTQHTNRIAYFCTVHLYSVVRKTFGDNFRSYSKRNEQPGLFWTFFTLRKSCTKKQNIFLLCPNVINQDERRWRIQHWTWPIRTAVLLTTTCAAIALL